MPPRHGAHRAERSRGSGEPQFGGDQAAPRPSTQHSARKMASGCPGRAWRAGGAQHGVAMLGPRLGPAAAQVPPGRAGERSRAGGRGGTDGLRLFPRRLTVLLEQRQGFRRARPRSEEPPAVTAAEARPGPPDRRRSLCPPPPPSRAGRPSARRLVKPFLFAVGFTGSAFGSAAIWQYESLKSRVQSYFEEARADWFDKMRPQKRGDFRKQVNSWWNSLTEGQRTVTGIIAANVFVFCLWRLPGMRRFMFTYFTSDPSSRALCSPMLLSTFSHFSLFHMAANMYVLWSFSSSIVSLLGCEQFLAVYLSAGVISTFVSYVAKMATGRFEPSLGASGAIMTVLAAVCTKMPEAKLAIIFLPMFTFTAGSALKAIIAFDSAGLALGWRLFDHAAHLGGALFGMWYVTYGHELIWKNREPLVKAWHEMRTKNTGKGGGGRSN
ncbi:presenilins-associated rhomboid-like protein, mitochondrial isoform X1 [Pezoporus wallicus]|uniref:presenilins-associated rhomboid-like protein, mitochondrial isoform X1 n=1 Tax=Pezoporus wallicus TaxID=35540 RepID=UPI00254E5998|nr:presenilins-associated rhomboid-like protein, mitochondrial isoform X1 [Pezoporus wallicus]